MEIKVGEYVRTKNGLIGKVNKIELAGSGVRFAGEYLSDTIIQFNDGKVYERRVKDRNIAKHSINLTDLIEIGDIVYTYDVLNYDVIYIYDDEMLKAVKQDIEQGIKIKTIWTKEQLKSIEYNV